MALDDQMQLLEWDSEFFGCRIARLCLSRLTEQSLPKISKWCAVNHIDCLYFLAEADDPTTVSLAEANGFRFVDVRLTLSRRIGGSSQKERAQSRSVIRACGPGDVAALRAIARVSYRSSRFYFDPSFPADLCDALYETWIEKSCDGYADEVLVAEIEGQVAGYLSCVVVGDKLGQIGLLGVGPEWRGMGVGAHLVDESLGWFEGRGLDRVQVVTQARNRSAQRLYQRNGFLTESVQLWYHKWYGA